MPPRPTSRWSSKRSPRADRRRWSSSVREVPSERRFRRICRASWGMQPCSHATAAVWRGVYSLQLDPALMFPLRDDNPTLRTPVVTYALIAANVIVWVLVQGMGNDPQLAISICNHALIPGEFLHTLPAGSPVPMGPGIACVVSDQATWYKPLSSMFMHGSWMHLIGNMWFLHIFGNNVEDSQGRGRFLLFYLLCGLAAGLTQTF